MGFVSTTAHSAPHLGEFGVTHIHQTYFFKYYIKYALNQAINESCSYVARFWHTSRM